MNREVLDKWFERGVLALVLIILVLGPLAYGAVGTLPFLIIQGLAMGALALWGARMWLNRRPQFLWPPICWFVVAFVGYAIYRYLTCDIEYAGRHEFIQVLLYACLFFVAINNLHRQEFTQVIAFTLIALATLISSYAIFQFATNTNRVWLFRGFYPGRGSGTYLSPNHLAGFLEMLLPLALAYTLVGRVKPVTRILLGYAAGVMLVGIGVTLSRGGWVACGVSLVVFFSILTLYRSYRIGAILMLAVLLGGGLFLAPKSAQLKERVARTDVAKLTKTKEDARADLWEAGWDMWRANFWVGVGPGHYNYRFPNFHSQAAQLIPDFTHNDYLNTLADWGTIGGAILALTIGALLFGVLKSWRYVRRAEMEFQSNRSNKFAFVLGSSMGLLALLCHSFMDFNLHIPANAILAVTLVALLSAHLRFATDGYWVTARWWGKTLGNVALLAALAYFANQGRRAEREYAWLERADKLPTYSPARFSALTNAVGIEPMNFETTYRLGELYRMQSFEGGETYAELANEAMLWYGRATNANRFDPLNYIGIGQCLDVLEKHDEAEAYFFKADDLDPNGFLTAAQIGAHYVEKGNLQAAKQWLERSARLEWTTENKIARPYLAIVEDRLKSPPLSGLLSKPPENPK